ncbi:mucin-binding protein [Limosilactobacillus reuteri]|nr:LPXTG cell wall anchor domain-containing protein [Limosilactobacillus reuteri]
MELLFQAPDQPQFPNNPDNPAEGNPGNKPDVPNWTPTEPGTTVSPNPNDPGANVNVPYTQDQGSITVTVHDVTDNVNLPQYGKTSGEQDVGTTFTYDKNTVITDLENKGYKVLNPDVVIPTTISKGAQNIVINVEHQLVPVTPENPGTPGQPINPNDPDGPKWPDGTAKNDLEVTGTQTIHYEGAGDNTPADNTQHFTFTKSATVDKVTGKIVSETGWNVASHTFGNVNTPVVAGYHADKVVAGGATITPDDLNKTIVVTYAPNGHVIPVGPDGTPIPGADQPQFPTNPDNPTGTTPSEVPVVPGYHPETGKPGDPVDPVPGKPGENVPVKYVPDNPTPETYNGSQTIKFVDGDGTELHAPDIQTADKLTGDHTFGKINTPVIKGYTTTQTTAGGATVTKDNPNATITVMYTPNGHIIPVGPDGKPIPDAPQPQFPTNPDNPSETTPGQVPDVPGYHPETGKPGDPVDPVPGKPGEDVPVKYVPDTPTPETYTGSQTIKFVDGMTGKEIESPNVQTATDLTGDHTFGKINTPVIKGYTTTQTTAGGATVTKTDPNATITVTYTPNGHIIPVGPDGNPIPGADQPQFPTNPDNPSETTPGQVPVVPGYHPETGKPGDPVDPVPGQPGEDVPVKYVPDTPTPETYTGSQTIKFVDGTTGKEIETPNVQTAPDLTGDHTFGKINTPVIKGYTTTQTTAGGATVTKTDPNATITVTYTPNGHIIPVGPDGTPIPGADQPQFPTNPDNPSETTPGQVPDVPGYHPETGKPGEPVNPVPGQPGEDVPVKYVPDTPVEQGSITVTVRDTTDNVDLPQYGKSSGEENVGTTFTYDKNTVIQELEDKGYKVLNPDVVIPTTISKGAQNIVINVEHQLVPVTPENPGTPGQPINPNDRDGPKWPDGTAKDDLEATGTQTIHYEGAGDKTPANNVQHFTFTKSAVVDKVTGKIVSETGWNVASHTFGNIDTPVVPGYHADKAVAGGTTITPDDLNKTVTVTYTPNGHIIPVGPDGKPLPNVPQPQYPTNPNNPTEVTPNEPVPEIPGYTPNVSTVTPENPGENTPVVYTPNEKPVEPTTPSENGTPNGNTGNPTTPQPETPAKPTTPTTTPAGNGNIPTNGQTTSPVGSSVTTSNVNNANAITPAAQKQAAQLPQTGNEQLKHEGILGLLALGVAGLLAFGKKRRKE